MESVFTLWQGQLSFSRKVCLASSSGSSFLHFIILANRKFSWLDVETVLLKSKPVTFFLLLDECRKLTAQSLPAAVFMCWRAVSMSWFSPKLFGLKIGLKNSLLCVSSRVVFPGTVLATLLCIPSSWLT